MPGPGRASTRRPWSRGGRTRRCRPRRRRRSGSRSPRRLRAGRRRRPNRPGRRSDRQGVTTGPEDRGMPPDRLDTSADMNRSRGRHEPSPLEQIPVWDGFVPDAPAEAIDGDPPAGLDALLGGLNPEQLKAVTHGEGPLLVVAGAGTGKTQVITRRIAWLIATRRARPSEILALTFTDKAAEEMQLRVDQLVPYGYADTAISTFHAFGDRIIREFAFELGLPPDVRVLTRAEVIVFLRERLFELGLQEYRPLGDSTRFLGALAQLFARCRDEDISPGDYAGHAERVSTEAARLADAAGLVDEPDRTDAAAAAAEGA